METRSEKKPVSLEVLDLSVIYGTTPAVSNVNFSVSGGEFLTILGPSGAGKSSILMAIAGLFRDLPNCTVRGRILFGENDVSDLPANKRETPLVFQEYALFPHLTVFENIAFPLVVRKMNRSAIASRVNDTISLLKLTGLENRKPHELSGGQRQRVALGRAIIISPGLLLLDEPLSALDRYLRDIMQIEIKELQKNLGVTVVYVTHDQTEALTLSDRIAVLNKGSIEQIGTPKSLYESPKNHFVAEFFGESNFFRGIVKGIENNFLVIEIASGEILQIQRQENLKKGDQVLLLVRPEHISVGFSNTNNANQNRIKAIVKEIIYLGHCVKYRLVANNGKICTVVTPCHKNYTSIQPNEVITVKWEIPDTKVVAE